MGTATRHWLVATFVSGLISACAPAVGDDGHAAPRLASRQGEVQVTNDGHQDIVLYLFRETTRYRLGRVTRMETASFRIPDSGTRASYQVQLVAQPVGGGPAFSTGRFVWRPGQSLRSRVGRTVSSQHFVMLTLH